MSGVRALCDLSTEVIYLYDAAYESLTEVILSLLSLFWRSATEKESVSVDVILSLTSLFWCCVMEEEPLSELILSSLCSDTVLQRSHCLR